MSEARAKNSKGGTLVTGTPAKSKVHAPGLQNLGNTCFFNSVVQVNNEFTNLVDMIKTPRFVIVLELKNAPD